MLYTVLGAIDESEMGKALVHEHIMVDFSPADEQHVLDDSMREEVVRIMSPYLQEMKDFGFRTLFECTPRFLGRDIETLISISRATGVHIVSNTGFYAFGGYKHIPLSLRDASPETFASLWIDEFSHGIEGTGVKPGFIKTSVNHGPLGDLDRRLIIAAALTHLETGLTIACHTGEKECALGVAGVIEEQGVDPSALIIVHADQVEDMSFHLSLLERGFWLEYDNVGLKPLEYHVELISTVMKHGVGSRVLLSHDAGWYTVGEPEGGKDSNRPYTAVARSLIPALKARGYGDEVEEQLLVTNPREAFRIRVRRG
ncbi:aryldialkylphosphatase [Spirochaeta thermophila DSM 6578]|uniref:Aryldialkylphosphatase n=1 Tax=Winmispira thermophila (strain ATCC 700085 / DSM 6578 / Z-1203) TaxID=869211 RepID=G0GAK2_WINT7|nr:aryldialkylphosphatase [Spirochaeta thermophila]AEJ60967.1 aryldialkylphosphatase [Spirochaeta thermophila DSM 6578]